MGACRAIHLIAFVEPSAISPRLRVVGTSNDEHRKFAVDIVLGILPAPGGTTAGTQMKNDDLRSLFSQATRIAW